MSEWEKRRKGSRGYYLCLMLLFWPILLIPIQFVVAPSTLTFETLAYSFAFSVFIVGLAVGCGAKYHYRGINPASRTVLTSKDEYYE